MLKIAVIANSYVEAKTFTEYKFKDKIKEIRHSLQKYTLHNEDEIYLCYGEDDKNKIKYKSMEYDAFVIHPNYHTLLDVIRHRSER